MAIGDKHLLTAAIVTLLVVGSLPVFVQAAPVYSWASADYDGQNTNKSPQDAIGVQNIQNLQIQWIYQVPVNPFSIPGAAPSLGIETTPLDVSGILYLATPYNRLVALNSATGGVVWSYQVNMSKFADYSWWARAYVISSLSYYDGTVYMMASDTSVYAFNAITGAVQFVIPTIAADVPGNTGQYYGEKAPVVYRNMIIVRPSTTDYGGRGFVAAYGLQTHALLWRWFSVPPTGGDPNWDANAGLGNIKPYHGDWGTTDLIGGGAAWGTMTIDDRTGVLYLSTGHPSGQYDAALRPGPNLYADSIVALNANDGKLLWYYQINPHDVTEHEGGWSIVLANITVNGQKKDVVIQAAKSNYIYVLDAATGVPVYTPFLIGPASSSSPNDNGGSSANLTLSQSTVVGRRICPGPDGGVEMSPAIDGNNLLVATQNACGLMFKGPVTYKGQTFSGFVYDGDPTALQNSTLYSLDLSKGSANWKFEMPNRYQGSSAVVSGGVVYVVDRGGILYALNEQTGALLKKVNLGGLGASGVSIGTNSRGEIMVYVPAGGGDLPSPTPGLVLGLGLSVASTGSAGSDFYTQELPVIALGVVVVLLSFYVVWQRASRQKS